MKFIFIDKIIYQNDIQSARIFYNDYISSILKKIYINTKNKLSLKNTQFLNFINLYRSDIEKDHNFLEINIQKFFEKFITLLEEAFKQEQVDMTSHNVAISPIFKIDKKHKHSQNNINSDNMSEIEDIIFSINFNNDIYNTNKTIIFNVSKDTNNNVQNKQNKFKITKSYQENSDDMQSTIKTSNTRIRRVNLAKKIIRKFKKYLKTTIYSNYNSIIMSNNNIFSNLPKFWLTFIKDKLMPPFKSEEYNVEFKSFSHCYFKWLFSHEKANDLYKNYLEYGGEKDITNIVNSYDICEEEKKNHLYFLLNFSEIFGNKNSTNSDCDLLLLRDEQFYKNDYNKADLFEQEEENRYFYERRRDVIDFEVFDKFVKSDSSNSSIDKVYEDGNKFFDE